MKPVFYRHEGLNELEEKHGQLRPMLVFSGLWGHCDKKGRFQWKPKTLKLDILPFVSFDMAETLGLLADSGFIRRYSSDGKEYGVIESFGDHQRISGKESQEPELYPEPPETSGEASAKHPRSEGEATGIAGREGKGREEEGNGYVGPKPDVSSLGKEFRKQAREIIAFLNQRAGRNFDLDGVNADHVVARLKDGESVEVCKALIALKVREWKGDEKMVKYLRPETLFGRTKFASYKGEIGSDAIESIFEGAK